MKYKVIGWTYYDNSEILTSDKSIGFAERNAIIDDIRKNKYLFTGYDHQETWDGVVPILNDGLKRCFSQRGFGGVMAEAYGYMRDYDYASFTFDGSINEENIKMASDDFDIESYVGDFPTNEHFDVWVNEGLFLFAKNKNPFYLDDLDSLRFIDEDDTITLHCNDEELSFCVKSINRNKKKIDFKDHDLIDGEYKIIVTHKPIEKKRDNKFIICSRSKAFDIFNDVLVNYDFETLNCLLNILDINSLISDYEFNMVKDTFIRFVYDYVNVVYDSSKLVGLLDYINDCSLYKDIALRVFNEDKYVMVSFINKYIDSDFNVDDCILLFVNNLKRDDFYAGTLKILFRAVCLRPYDKDLCKKYYRAVKDTNREGFSLMANLGLYGYLRKDDKCLIALDNYLNHDTKTTMRILEYLTYPNNAVYSRMYPYSLPKIYENDNELFVNGIYAYQKYVKEHFNVDDFMLDMLVNAVDKICYKMDCYYRGYDYAANYILALDLLTDFKYNLKKFVLSKYNDKSFVKIINEIYK